jgi:hypothetical protein
MNGTDWEIVESLFHRARELDEAERDQLLAEQPDDIRRKVESLLQHAEQARLAFRELVPLRSCGWARRGEKRPSSMPRWPASAATKP